MLKVLPLTGEPVTAAQLAKLTAKPHKLSEAAVKLIVDERVARGELRQFPGATAKGKPRFWDRDEATFASGAMVALLDKKGPQTKAATLKAAKGINATVAANALQSLIDSRRVFEHPGVGSSKAIKFGATPPAPEPYLKEVSSKLATVVSKLTSVGVKREMIADAVAAMVTQCGLPFSRGSVGQTPSARELDLLMLMRQIEPGAERGTLVPTRELRRAANLDKAEFDRAVLDLAQSGRIMLHRHDHPSGLSQRERDELVTDGAGAYFVGVAIRKAEC